MRQRDQVRGRVRLDATETFFLPKRGRAVERCHLDGGLWGKARILFQERPHFGEESQIRIARQTIGPEANVEPERLQPLQLEWRMPKKTVAPRAMRDVKFRRGFEQREVRVVELVQMRDDPGPIDTSRSKKTRNRRLA